MAVSYHVEITEVDPDDEDLWTLSVEMVEQTDFVDEVFLLTSAHEFVRVCTMADLATWPDAQDPGLTYYRSSSFTKTYTTYEKSASARAAIAAGLEALRTTYTAGADQWGRTFDLEEP